MIDMRLSTLDFGEDETEVGEITSAGLSGTPVGTNGDTSKSYIRKPMSIILSSFISFIASSSISFFSVGSSAELSANESVRSEIVYGVSDSLITLTTFTRF